MGYRDIVKWSISIHALRKESDLAYRRAGGRP